MIFSPPFHTTWEELFSATMFTIILDIGESDDFHDFHDSGPGSAGELGYHG